MELLIEPRDTVLFGDGRPFTAGGGSDGARSLGFPWPTTVAGLVRTRLGLGADGRWNWSPTDAQQTAIRGPLLARVERGRAQGLLVPAPMDAVWFGADREGMPATLRGLAPVGAWDKVTSDLESGLEAVGLRAVDEHPGKPIVPIQFWFADTFVRWLREPLASVEGEPAQYGVGALPTERRVHVAIDRATSTASDGKLYSTQGLRFAAMGDAGIENYALWCDVDVPPGRTWRNGVAPLGGERRPAFVNALQQSALGPLRAPALRTGSTSCRLRVVLLTPAVFDGGFKPLDNALDGARIVAAVVGRPLSISGWDAALNAPKASRRAAPAGSVYWLEFPTRAAAESWATAHHFSSVSTAQQDQRDGLGLIAVGEGE